MLGLLLFAQETQAANLSLQSNQQSWPLEEKVEIVLSVDTEGQQLNAFEGEISYPADLLNFDDIRDNDSIVNFWIEKSAIDSPGLIRFSGIVPGGFQGHGNLFKVYFITQQEGQGAIMVNQARVLLNDGQGTEASVKINNLNFNISAEVESDEVIVIDVSDVDPPEPFTPIITQISEIAGDKYLIIFATQDKGLGIDYYQVKEGLWGFTKADSPYVLRNQKLNQKIVVKAVDKAGNERRVTIDPVYPPRWYEKTSFFAIIIVIAIVFFAVVILSRKNKKNKNENKK